MTRLSIAAPFGLAALLVTVPAHAQSADWLQDLRPSYAPDARQYSYDARRAGYDKGYREGLKEGEKDGKRNDVYDYRDEKAFQRADKGFRRDFGSLERYQQSFRSGFTAGYNDAYQRYGPRNANYGNGRYDTRGPVWAPGRQTTYPRSYPGSGYPGSSGSNYSPAFQNGTNVPRPDARRIMGIVTEVNCLPRGAIQANQIQTRSRPDPPRVVLNHGEDGADRAVGPGLQGKAP